QRPGVPRRRLHLRERTPRPPLRYPRRAGGRVPPGVAGRHAARRPAHPGERAGGHVQPDADLAGQARQVGPGNPPRHPASAPAAGRGGLDGRRKSSPCRQPAAADGAAPNQPELCLVPRPHGPARLRPGELRRPRRLADARRPAPDRRLGYAAGRAIVRRPGRIAGDPEDAAAGVRALPDGEAAHLRAGPRRGRRRPPGRGRDRAPARPQGLSVLGAGAGRRAERAIPEARSQTRGAMTKHLRISRRTVLKGMGAAVALPWLEAMLPVTGLAGTAAGKPPLRLAFLYVPNGVHLPDWTPATVGADFQLPPILQPLRAVKDDLLVLSGLTLDKARAHGDGGGDHARAMAAFLTGRHPRKTNGADLRAGISVDQVAAERVGRATRFPSLEIGCEGGKNAGACDHGYSCAYQTNLSWRGDSTPMAKEIDPRLVFERLFGGRFAGDRDAGSAKRERDNRSVLDFVAEDAGRLRPRLGANDRRKLDEYLTDIREV